MLGHDVRVVLIGHHGARFEPHSAGNVTLVSLDFRSQGWRRLNQQLESEATQFSPDWVIGMSDAWVGWLAHRTARKCGARLAIDAYDNYEAYMPWNLPLHRLWRRAVRAADLVTAAGPQLAKRLDKERRGKSATAILPMAADPIFQPRDQALCRQELGLPAGVPLLGYCGSWAANRGTDSLARMFRIVRRRIPSARLILTGVPPPSVLREAGVMPLGYIEDGMLPTLISALDAACVITANSSFGRFSYPAKLCEAMACGTPVAASDSPPIRWMLNNDERFLAPIGDEAALAECALTALSHGRCDYGKLVTWESASRDLDHWLRLPPLNRAS